MSLGSTLVIVVLICAISVLLMQRAENRKEREAGPDKERERQLASERDAAQAELTDLRERVRVLERIATDGRKSADLHDEIEKLRDR